MCFSDGIYVCERGRERGREGERGRGGPFLCVERGKALLSIKHPCKLLRLYLMCVCLWVRICVCVFLGIGKRECAWDVGGCVRDCLCVCERTQLPV